VRDSGEDAEPVAALPECVEHLDHSRKCLDARDDVGEVTVEALGVGR
jgi:hypothetical protein